MKVLDIDMDFFLNEKTNKFENRADPDYIFPWKKTDIINFLENNLGLKKSKKIKGRIIQKHNESFYFWREQINDGYLKIPFEIVHVDSHMDLGLGYGSWVKVLDEIISYDIGKREKIIIQLKGEDGILSFPLFDSNSMYKGMELNKYYTIEYLELGKDW